MPTLNLKPTHKAVTAYYDSLAEFTKLGIAHETAVRSAFQTLLESAARQFDWKLVPEYAIKRKGAHPLKADAALLDPFGLNHGLWEAKDTQDDLAKEIKAKFKAGYPQDNILFWQPKCVVLYQQGERIYEGDLTKPDDLVHALRLFLEYAPPALADWEKAVEGFKDKIPELGRGLGKLIVEERRTNKRFIAAFTAFLALCRGSLNPNLSEAAVEEMIIQHLLTERIFRKIFAEADFMQRNVIAQEIEKVISALTSKAFNRDQFVQHLGHFYVAIENAAATIHDFAEKQTFLNTIYERFFQGFCVKVADTHGIVYTPQPLVNFMVASVEQVLKDEFTKSLADKDVHILDPFTGTGNFIVNLMKHIPRTALPHKYRHELHCNEIMLLPYYVASMNLEHAYYEATGTYEPFEGICLVDTFRTLEPPQTEFSFLSEKNSARVERQKQAPIRVILGNPPYNAWQADENENNRNLKYSVIDKRVKDTYSDASSAQNKNSLSDPYVKAFRYASDKIGECGVVAYVTNGAFVDSLACDGMRQKLAQEFDLIYVLDLGGNVRKNPKLSGTTHNVFGIQVNVCITILVKRQRGSATLPRSGRADLPVGLGARRSASIHYHAVPVDWRKEQKYQFLELKESIAKVKWHKLKPDKKYNWLDLGYHEEFDHFLPLGDRDSLAGGLTPPIFNDFGRGLETTRDDWVYGYDRAALLKRVGSTINYYNDHVYRYQRLGNKKPKVDDFVDNDATRIGWSSSLKKHLERGIELRLSDDAVREALYRPYCSRVVYYDKHLNHRVGLFPETFPNANTKNRLLWLKVGSDWPMFPLIADRICDLMPQGGSQCFPIYSYAEEEGGKKPSRHDNITLAALVRFQNFYADDALTREDVFYYVYAVLHHPAYRTRYAENLKRELPRIPFIRADGTLHAAPVPGKGDEQSKRKAKEAKQDAAVFHAFATAGRKLADLHVHYESAKEFPLKRIENKEVPLNWRVEVMKLSKDKSALLYNDFLTLTGIPPEVFDYRLGNRSALDWVIDQYRVTRDEHGHVTSDPNRLDDEQYIVRLLGQVITVSLETQKIVKRLPTLNFLPDEN